MDSPPEPPPLDYATPEERLPQPTHPIVGWLGFLCYGIVFLFLTAPLGTLTYAMLHRTSSSRGIPVAAIIVTGFWLFSLWRAIAALRGVLRNKR